MSLALTDERELLEEYVANGSRAAFTELVDRHINLVFRTALRRVGGDTQLAEDVTQEVFIALARKANQVKNRPTLAGWLYTSSRFAAAQTVRTERRRRARETEAAVMKTLTERSALDWVTITPLLDQALEKLSESDRELLILRFFENYSLAAVGVRYSISPDAARMRVERAVEKMRSGLARQGVKSSSAVVIAALTVQAVQAVPSGLAAKVAAGVFHSAVSAAAAGTGIKTATAISSSKLTLGIAAGVIAAVGWYYHANQSESPTATPVSVAANVPPAFTASSEVEPALPPLTATAPAAATKIGRSQTPPPEQSNQPTTQYRIITNDWLMVTIAQEPGLQTKAWVDAAGNINCPLIGQVHVYGLSIREAEQKIEDAYIDGRFLKGRKVTVTVLEYAPRNCTVTGHVKNPGRLTLDVETAVTLPDIIRRAGGFDDTAKGTAVRVTRVMPDGSTQVMTFDVNSLLQGKTKNTPNPAADFKIQPNDIIFVPQRLI